jgi:hypothetical protein
MTQIVIFYFVNKYRSVIHGRKISVKSRNPWSSVIQTTNDIIKAHGGILKVESKEGEGTQLIIQLPLL